MVMFSSRANIICAVPQGSIQGPLFFLLCINDTACCQRVNDISIVILLHEKFLQSVWLRAVVFQLNLKYVHVKITTLLRVVV